MILCIGEILTAVELQTIVAKLDTAKFIDGKATAGWHARLVKHNTQLPPESPALAIVRELISAALQRHALFQMAGCVLGSFVRSPSAATRSVWRMALTSITL